MNGHSIPATISPARHDPPFANNSANRNAPNSNPLNESLSSNRYSNHTFPTLILSRTRHSPLATGSPICAKMAAGENHDA